MACISLVLSVVTSSDRFGGPGEATGFAESMGLMARLRGSGKVLSSDSSGRRDSSVELGMGEGEYFSVEKNGSSDVDGDFPGNREALEYAWVVGAEDKERKWPKGRPEGRPEGVEGLDSNEAQDAMLRKL
jgi:hypothetical protein